MALLITAFEPSPVSVSVYLRVAPVNGLYTTKYSDTMNKRNMIRGANCAHSHLTKIYEILYTNNYPVPEYFKNASIEDLKKSQLYDDTAASYIKNIDDFFSGYSNPTSRELMRIYKDLELVEHLGSGLNRILEAYDKDSFVIKQNYMKNIFYKNETPLNGIVSGGVNGVVSGGVTELLEFIQINPGLKANELSKHIDTPLRTVQRWLKQLKDENKIEFQGAPKTGGYVLKDMKS